MALLAGLASCAVRRPSMEAPPRARHQYQHRQRVHERERRRRVAMVVFHRMAAA